MIQPAARLLFLAAFVAAVPGLLAAEAAPPASGEAREATVRLRDVASETALDFVHWNGRTGELFFPEMTGQGGAFFDADGDGDLDVYLVQGAGLGGEPLEPFAGQAPPRDRLFRNDLGRGAAGEPVPRFVDVTDAAGLEATGYGIGVATGDYDADGDIDLYVTNFGPNQLWRNDGVGPDGQPRFTDVTAVTGTEQPGWSTGAAFFDADADGDLDLYVVNYVDFRLDNNVTCYATSSRRDYCGPSAYGPVDDALFVNLGHGEDGQPRFENVLRRAVAGYRAGRGLGVVAADFDGDLRPDLFVANDGEPNQLWRNQGVVEGRPTFADDALLAGVAVNRQGSPEASMGIAPADFDHDGDEDLFLTHLAGETNTLYVNTGGGLFDDRTAERGLAAASLPFTAFGTGWLDLDRDGWLDLLVVNGAVRILEDRALAGDDYPLDQSDQVFRNRGDGSFEDVSAIAGAILLEPAVSRGAAFGDVDDDGDTDVLVTVNNGTARLLRNESPAGPWVGLRLRDGAGADAIGARAALTTSRGRTLWRRVHTDGSYASASDPRLLFALVDETVAKLVVTWADGGRETFPPPPLDRYTTLVRGRGQGPPGGDPK